MFAAISTTPTSKSGEGAAVVRAGIPGGSGPGGADAVARLVGRAGKSVTRPS